MDIVELIQSAKARIASNDPVFNEQVSTTVSGALLAKVPRE